MNSPAPMDPHLSESDLFRQVEGVTPPDETEAVNRHLSDCWRCRARIAALESAIHDAVSVYTTSVPGPSAPVSLSFAAVARRAAARIAGVASVALVLLMVWPGFAPATVSAAEVLDRADSVFRRDLTTIPGAVIVQTVDVQWQPTAGPALRGLRRISRTADAARVRVSDDVGSPRVFAALDRALSKTGFGPASTLDAASISTRRRRVAVRESLERLPATERASITWRVTHTPRHGGVPDIRFDIRSEDWRIVRVTYIAGDGAVIVDELSRVTLPAHMADVVFSTRPSPDSVSTSNGRRAIPSSTVTPAPLSASTDIDVRHALHLAGVVWPHAVTLTDVGDGIRVSVSADPERRAMVERQLAALALGRELRLEWRPSATSADVGATVPVMIGSALARVWTDRFHLTTPEQQLVGLDDLSRFLGGAEDGLRRHAVATADLAAIVSDDSAALEPDSVARWQSMVVHHAGALVRTAFLIHDALGVDPRMCGPATAEPVNTVTAARRGIAHLTDAVDRAIGVMRRAGVSGSEDVDVVCRAVTDVVRRGQALTGAWQARAPQRRP